MLHAVLFYRNTNILSAKIMWLQDKKRFIWQNSGRNVNKIASAFSLYLQRKLWAKQIYFIQKKNRKEKIRCQNRYNPKKTDINGRSSGLKCQSIFLILLSIYNTIFIRSNLLCIATNKCDVQSVGQPVCVGLYDTLNTAFNMARETEGEHPIEWLTLW
jgi:hypothetical protein